MRLLPLAVLVLGWASPGTAGVKVISQGSPAHRWVALTFDAGADHGYAGAILGTLERDHIRATFGMTGRWAVSNRDLVRRMARDGDEIINHTYDHRSFTGYSTRTAPMTQAARKWEIEQTDRVVRSITGHGTKPYFRPPYGDYDQATLSLLKHLGYRYMVMWTVDSLGWDHLPPGAIYTRCTTLVRPGAIFLMHVGAQSQDAIALGAIVRDLRRRGYSFRTVAQLVAP